MTLLSRFLRRGAGSVAGERSLVRSIVVLAAMVGLVLAFAGIGSGVDQDLQLWRDAVRARPATGRVALVEIDARSLSKINRWPWSRRLHAQAIEALDHAGAQTIAFDVDFSARSNAHDDARLANAILRSRATIILPTFRQPSSQGGGGFVENLPLPEFARSAQLASVNIQADPDGRVRNYPYGIVTAGVTRPSVGALLAGSAGAAGKSFAVDGSIDPASVPRISFVDLIRGKVPAGALRGRGVLVGATAIEMGDQYPFPGHGVLPGALIQVLAAETLLQGTIPSNHGALPLLALVVVSLPLILRRPQGTQLIDLCLASLLLLVTPLILECARLGTLDILPAEGALVFAVVASAIAASVRAARYARLFDGDTGLPNRGSLQQSLVKEACGSALIALRIDSYGNVAGVLGQNRAAELMLRVSERLALACGGLVHRVEESALAWLVTTENTEEQVDRLDAAAALLRAPIEVAGRKVELEYAFGIVNGADGFGTDDIAHALLAADHALARGERWDRYTLEIDRASDWRLSLAGELDRAMAAGEIWVAYQPKYDVKLERVIGAEALVRWRHPERGPIPPDAFIPVLEQNGRILDLTLHVLRQATRDAQSWAAAGCNVNVAVNVSALLPADPAFLAGLEETLAAERFDPGMLTLEVTESATMTNPDAAVSALKALAAMGIRLSIDDYGTGQSTLTYLKRLPGSEIKIDKSFILPLETSRGDQAMVRSTIELAHELGYKVVAEGVETAQILDILRSYDCDVAQGWHVGKPMPAEEFAAIILRVRQAA